MRNQESCHGFTDILRSRYFGRTPIRLRWGRRIGFGKASFSLSTALSALSPPKCIRLMFHHSTTPRDVGYRLSACFALLPVSTSKALSNASVSFPYQVIEIGCLVIGDEINDTRPDAGNMPSEH